MEDKNWVSSLASTNKPLSLVRCSLVPPTSEDTTGKPAAKASSTTQGKFSQLLNNINRSLDFTCSATISIGDLPMIS